MSEYVPTVGLEIHAELKTKTKMFCRSLNHTDETQPNVNICPICLAHPGTLPVINREAVRHVLRVGVAVGGTLADYTEFDRKNYFYPDLPKGYQLSQYEYPLVSGGGLHGVALTRIHLEEDTASSMHDEESGVTTIDYNRAGIPLMELVTEPVIKSAEEAGDFARELQLLLRYLGVSEANLEKGEMRVEANISVGRDGKLGTKVEVKNLNSFRTMERAVAYEIKRQRELLEQGKEISQETRGWDEGKQATFSQRTKEGSADYRYFPDPDLPSLKLSELSDCTEDALMATMPELPGERRTRYLSLGLKAEDVEQFIKEPILARLMDELTESYGANKSAIILAANYIVNDLAGIIRDSVERDSENQPNMPISTANFKKIIDMLHEGKISSRVGKDMIAAFVAGEDEDPEVYAESEGFLSKNDQGEIEMTLQNVLSEHPEVAADYRKGKQAALEYLLGQAMKALRGAANPVTLRDKLKELLS